MSIESPRAAALQSVARALHAMKDGTVVRAVLGDSVSLPLGKVLLTSAIADGAVPPERKSSRNYYGDMCGRVRSAATRFARRVT